MGLKGKGKKQKLFLSLFVCIISHKHGYISYIGWEIHVQTAMSIAATVITNTNEWIVQLMQLAECKGEQTECEDMEVFPTVRKQKDFHCKYSKFIPAVGTEDEPGAGA